MVTQILLNTTQTITLKAGRYTFVNNELGYRKHYGHSIEIPDFANAWHCHTCEKYWDEASAEEYKDLMAQLQSAGTLTDSGIDRILSIDTHTLQDNWKDY